MLTIVYSFLWTAVFGADLLMKTMTISLPFLVAARVQWWYTATEFCGRVVPTPS